MVTEHEYRVYLGKIKKSVKNITSCFQFRGHIFMFHDFYMQRHYKEISSYTEKQKFRRKYLNVRNA